MHDAQRLDQESLPIIFKFEEPRLSRYNVGRLALKFVFARFGTCLFSAGTSFAHESKDFRSILRLKSCYKRRLHYYRIGLARVSDLLFFQEQNVRR